VYRTQELYAHSIGDCHGIGDHRHVRLYWMADPFESVEVAWRRAGVYRGVLPAEWGVYPDAVIGRLTGGSGRSEEDGRGPAAIADGDGYLLRPATRHRFVQLAAKPCTYRWMHASFRVLGTVDLLSLIDVPPRLRCGERLGAVAEAFVAAERLADPLRRAVERKRLGFELLTLLLGEARPSRDAIARLGAISRLQPALERMQGSLDQPHGRTALARLVGLSPTRFHAVFARALGCAPMAYLQRLRIARAQHLLIATDDPIAAVGRAVGVPDQFHFSRLFRRRVGESPTSYRIASRRALAPPDP
jgi:AraC-like DNA-binding protein